MNEYQAVILSLITVSAGLCLIGIKYIDYKNHVRRLSQ